MLKDLGPNAFSYGYPMPILMVGTYNDDGSINVMALHETTRTNAGHLALCVGQRSQTHANIKNRRAFTVALVNRDLMSAVDYFGTASGRRVPDKFARTGLKATKSGRINAPIVEGSPFVVECELIEIVEVKNFTTVLAKIVNVAVDASVLDENGAIDVQKTGMLFFDTYSNGYFSLGERAGDAWGEGKKYL